MSLFAEMVGSELGGFRLTKLIGEGGMSAVFRGENLLDRTIVRAIKMVRPELASREEFVKRFAEEARILERLQHPNVMRFFGVRKDGDRLFMEVELLDGHVASPQHALGDDGRPVLRAVVDWVRQACDGVAAAHALGIVHRDLKPENLFVTSQGVKVLDFGIARALDEADRASQVTQAGSIPGTPAYMAPESCEKGTPSAASDVYALGICLLELAAGHHPLQPVGGPRRSSTELMFAHVRGELPALRQVRPDAPKLLEQVLVRALARDPAQRYPDAGQFAAALRSVVGQLPDLAPRATDPGNMTEFAITPFRTGTGTGSGNVSAVDFRPTGSRKGLWILLVVLMLVATGAGLHFGGVLDTLLADPPPPPPAPVAAPAPPAPAPVPVVAPPPEKPAPKPREPQYRAPQGMVVVKPGAYPVGCQPDDTGCYDDAQPGQMFQTEGFGILRYEAAARDYEKCQSARACPAAGRGKGCNVGDKELGGLPANCVDWAGARAYCAWKGWRLPSEMEWEAAARGPAHPDYPWGDEPPTCQRTAIRTDAGGDCAVDGTLPVDGRPADRSWCEAEGLGGNVREWTATDYGPYPNGSADEGLTGKVTRGGSWPMSGESMSRAHTRGADDASEQRPDLGFRCVGPLEIRE